MKFVNRLFSLLLTLALLLTCVPHVTVSAVTVDNGVVGEGLVWELEDTGVLTISGTGKMTIQDSAPWDYLREEITEVVIADGVTTVGYAAFQGCTALTAVSIPASVTAIDSWAFQGCSALTTVEIPDSVKTIGGYAFYGCAELQNLTLGAGLEKIGSSVGPMVFAGCAKLAEIIIPASVTYIAPRSFEGCEKLTKITFEGTAPEIATDAFKGVTAIAYYNNDDAWVKELKKTFDGKITWTIKTCKHSFGDWVKVDDNIHQHACSLCQQKESENHNYVPKVTDPTCLKDGYTTYTCSGCKDTYKGDEVKTEGHDFTDWEKVDEKTHKRVCKVCEDYSETKSHRWDEGVVTEPSLGAPGYTTYTCKDCGFAVEDEQNNYLAVGNCGTNDKKDNVQWTLDINGTLTIFGTGKMADYTAETSAPWSEKAASVKRLIVENGVTNIGDFAFIDLYNLMEVTLPKSVTTIGKAAFVYCASLTGLQIPDSVTTIGDYAFSNSALAEVKLPDSVKTIGASAFASCANLQSVDFGKGLITICEEAFSGCYNLTELALPNSLITIGDRAFRGLNLSKVDFGKGVTTIGEQAFQDCYNLTEVKLPASVITIKTSAFEECANLTTLVLPEKIKTIGERAFANCYSLSVLEIPGSVTEIKLQAFANCGSLTELIIPDSVKTIGYYAFENCYSLYTVDIGAGVTAIENGAFKYTGLSSIWFLGKAPAIAADAFTGVTADAYYFKDKAWPASAQKNYGGYLFWETMERDPAGETSGKCGASMTWKLEKDGTLILSGTGATDKFSRQKPAPWYTERAAVKQVVIEEGVGVIDQGAFLDCYNLTGIVLAESVTAINEGAFAECDKLVVVMYKGTIDKFQTITLEGYNDGFAGADCHFEVEKMPTEKHTYFCEDCELYFCMDGKPSLFADVATTSWQYKYAAYALANGLITGKGNDPYGRVKFDPNSPITREQFVQVLYSAEGKPDVDSDKVFPDVKDTWYKNAVLWAFEEGITSGLGTGKFGVGASITRQDIAVMLYKYAKLCGYDVEAKAGQINKYADGSKVSSYAKNAMDWAVTKGIISGSGTGDDLSTWKLNPTGKATRAECAAMLKSMLDAYGGI